MNSDQKLDKAKEILKEIVEDFDQTGCSEDLGVVQTDLINQARELFGMELLDSSDEEDEEDEEDQ